MAREPEDLDEAQRKLLERVGEQERAERVARVIESVRSGTYQVRSEVVANRLIETMLRRPGKR